MASSGSSSSNIGISIPTVGVLRPSYEVLASRNQVIRLDDGWKCATLRNFSAHAKATSPKTWRCLGLHHISPVSCWDFEPSYACIQVPQGMLTTQDFILPPFFCFLTARTSSTNHRAQTVRRPQYHHRSIEPVWLWRETCQHPSDPT